MLAPTDADRMAARARPPGQPMMYQRWENPLFLHWRWDAVEIQRTLPPGLIVDTFQGRAWLGVVPSGVSRVRPRLSPAVPYFSNFLTVIVRTYVFDSQGRPGVWCYSLDVNQWLAVKLARAWFCLPCEHADIATQSSGVSDEIDYRVRRQGSDIESRFVYKTVSGPAGASEAKPGSLEFFLIERYRMFSFDPRRGLFTGRIAHAPYVIAGADVPIWDDVMLRLAAFDSEGEPPSHICFANPLDVEIFSPERMTEPEPVLAGAPEPSGAGALAV